MNRGFSLASCRAAGLEFFIAFSTLTISGALSSFLPYFDRAAAVASLLCAVAHLMSVGVGFRRLTGAIPLVAVTIPTGQPATAGAAAALTFSLSGMLARDDPRLAVSAIRASLAAIVVIAVGEVAESPNSFTFVNRVTLAVTGWFAAQDLLSREFGPERLAWTAQLFLVIRIALLLGDTRVRSFRSRWRLAIFAPLVGIGVLWAVEWGVPQQVTMCIPLFVASLVAVAAGHEERTMRSGLGALASSVIVLALVIAMPLSGASDDSRPRRVATLDPKTIRFDSPDAEWSPAAAVPTFGRWVSMLERLGGEHEVIGDEPIEASLLSRLSAIVTVNLSRALSTKELDEIDAFVSDGGRLIVLADHTDIYGQIEPTNELLRRYGVTLRFDSAYPAGRSRSWRGAWRVSEHSLVAPLASHDELQWGVGGSLDLAGKARALISGCNVFSDRGNYEAAGFIGDRTLGRGERFGGLTLASETVWGRGRVLVLGDTSSLQDVSVTGAFAFVERLGRYALGHETRSSGGALAGVLCAFGVVLLTRVRDARSDGLATWILALATGLTGMIELHLLDDVASRIDADVLIDLGHGNDVTTNGTGSHTLSGFEKGLTRVGLSARRTRTFDPPTKAVAAIFRPREDFSDCETERLLSCVEQGGLAWLVAGRRAFEACPNLFGSLGIEIQDEPLGGGDLRGEWTNSGLRFDMFDAWPVASHPSTSAEVLATCFDRPVVVGIVRGEGKIVVCGDSRMFLGDSVESPRGEINENVVPFFEEIVAWSIE